MTNKSTITQQPSSIQRICPYTGLRSFSAEEALFFKGREVHVEKAIDLLEEKKFLMLTGASGDGKSSLIYAGLIPNAKAGFIRAKFSNWVIADFRPERKPLDNMASSLASQLQYEGTEMVKNSLALGYSALVDLYKNSTIYLDTESVQWKNADDKTRKKLMNSAPNLLILVDQFEEFFTNPENFFKGKVSSDSKTVVNLLLETNKIAVKHNLPIYIICTMRSDYIGHCTSFTGLPELIGQAHYFVPRLKRNEIFQIIDEPALLSGNAISARLVARLLNDVKEEGDVLPILQHALYQIWKTADDDNAEVMDLIHYTKVGGIPDEEIHRVDREVYDKWFKELPDYKRELLKKPSLDNVLNTHANELYETAHDYYNKYHKDNSTITKEISQKIIKITFTCLTKIDENKAVRNRMSVKEITEMIHDERIDSKIVIGVLNIFREPGNTLIRPYIAAPTKSGIKEWYNIELKDESVLDITHESLIRNWDRLARWVKEEHEGVNVFADIQQQLKRWLNNNKSKAYLLSPGQLNYFKSWHDLQQPTFAWIHRYMQDGETITTRREDGVPGQEKAKTLETEIINYLKKSKRFITQKRKLSKVALVVISALLVISTILFFNVQQQKNKALLSKNIAKSNEIALSASLILKDDPTVAFRLGEAAYKIHKTSLAKQVIMNAYSYPPYYNLLKGHNDIVNVVQFSPDGQLILSASRDNTARLWSREGELLHIFKGHDYPIFSAAFSSDGQYVLTASYDLTARIWDMQGNTLAVLRGHNNRLSSAMFSPDNKFILTASDDRTARIWDVSASLNAGRGNEISILVHDDKVVTVDFSPDSKTVLTSCEDNTARLWNLQGELLQVIKDRNINIRFAEFSSDGRKILTYGSGPDVIGAGNKVVIWDLKGRKTDVLTGESNGLRSVKFSPDGKYIAAGSDMTYAHLWNISEKKLILLKGHHSSVKIVKFSTDGEMILTVSEGFSMRLWNLNGDLLQILKSNDIAEDIDFSPDGRNIVSAYNKNNIRLWNIHNVKKSVLKGHDDFIWEVNISPDGEHIVTASWDNTARIWDKNGKILRVLKGHVDRVYHAGFSSDGEYIYTSSDDNTIRIWNLYGHLLTILKGHTETIHKPDFYPGGNFIVSPSADGTARVWNIEGKELFVLRGHRSGVRHAEFSPNGKYILTASADMTARLWDINGNELHVLNGHEAGIYSACFSPTGKYVITASRNGTSRIWNMEGKELAVCRGHTTGITNVRFSHNGKYFVTSGLDKTARLWDVAASLNTSEGKELHVFQGHTDMVNTVRFSPDDKYILTSSDDGTARLWDLRGNEINIYKGHNAAVQDAVFSPDGRYVYTCSADGTTRIWPLLVENVLSKINKKKERGNVWQMTDEDKRVFGIID